MAIKVKLKKLKRKEVESQLKRFSRLMLAGKVGQAPKLINNEVVHKLKREIKGNRVIHIMRPAAVIFHRHQQEKKRSNNQRCMEVENGTFTPLVFGTNGGVGSECSMFLATLAEKLSVVRSEDVNLTMEWLRAKLSFEVLRSALLCVRGSKKAWYKKDEVKISQDFGLSVVEAGL